METTFSIGETSQTMTSPSSLQNTVLSVEDIDTCSEENIILKECAYFHEATNSQIAVVQANFSPFVPFLLDVQSSKWFLNLTGVTAIELLAQGLRRGKRNSALHGALEHSAPGINNPASLTVEDPLTYHWRSLPRPTFPRIPNFALCSFQLKPCLLDSRTDHSEDH